MSALAFDRVTFAYGPEPLFLDFSLEVAEGEFLGVIGPNGAGKTTLLELGAGLLRPHSGGVSVGGERIAGMDRRAIARRVALVPQESHFAFDYRVRDVVMMGRNPYLGRFETPGPEDFARVEVALRFVDAAGLGDKSIKRISAGERQRVVLARSLAQETDILLLDEATSHLDISHQRSTLEILKKLNRRGKTIVFLSHDLNLAALGCSRLLLLNRGRIAAYDVPERVLTEELIGSVYGVRPILQQHPETGRPQVMLPAGEP